MDSNKNNSWLPENFIPGLVSVIIPAYNRSRFLGEAIQSVMDQTYRPVECIVVDDGSTDNSKELIESFAIRNDNCFRVKYIFQDNAGAQVARNTGTLAAEGELIQYLDSDDLLYPQKLEKQVAFLKENDECDVVFGNWRKGDFIDNELITSYAGEDMVTQFLTEHSIHTLSFLLRRAAVQKTGEWDTAIKRNQEIDFQLTALFSGCRFGYLPVECGLWRIHDLERIANTTHLKDVLFFYKKWVMVLKKKGLLTPKIRKNLAHIYYSFCLHNHFDNIQQKADMLCEAVRLHPEIPFANTPKMRLLKTLFGTRFSVRKWIIKVNKV